MPTSGLVKRFGSFKSQGKFTPADLCTLADYYKVSVEAMARRLEELSLLSAGTWENLIERGFKVREVQQELALNGPPRSSNQSNTAGWHSAALGEYYAQFPLRYLLLAIVALDQEHITEGRFAKLLRIDRLEARRVAELLRNYSNNVDQISALDLSTARRTAIS